MHRKASCCCVRALRVQPTAKVIRRQDLGLKSHPKKKEKPGIELKTPGLQAERLYHYTTEASRKESVQVSTKPD